MTKTKILSSSTKKKNKRVLNREIEYEDAPSGYVKLYNYKEPFMKFDGGFGYQGVLLFDGESEKIQCHMCGKWFDSLGNHINRGHNMKASDYKDITGLLQTTALINEKIRTKLISSGQSRFKNLKKGRKKTKQEIEKIRKTLLKNSNKRERENVMGSCPAQLIAKLQKEYEILGHTPRDPKHANRVNIKYRKEALLSAKRIGSREKYIRVFGSWAKACEMANIPVRKSGQTIHPKLSKKEQLLEFIRIFISKNKRLPSSSDSRRKLIPNVSDYQYHFGGLKKAIKLTQNYDNIKRDIKTTKS